MTLPSNTLQFIAEIRPKRRSHTAVKGWVALVDQAFLRRLGRICLVIAPVFFVFCGFSF